jgi:hypothetical protein
MISALPAICTLPQFSFLLVPRGAIRREFNVFGKEKKVCRLIEKCMRWFD